MLSRIRKFIPTDMMWDGAYEGGYVQVTLEVKYPSTGLLTVRGGNLHSVEVERVFNSVKDAVDCFNSLTVVRDLSDIPGFTGTRSGRYGKRMPYESTKLTPYFDDNTHQWIELYGDDFFLPTPVPWGARW